MKMSKLYKSAFLGVVGLLSLAACSEKEFITYDGSKAGIYLQRVSTTTMSGAPISFSDSITISFASYAGDIKEYKIGIPVCIMGNVAAVDRRFDLYVDKDKTTAIEGEDYAFSDTACYIPAGKSKQTVYVKLLRSDHLAKETLRLIFSIRSNENFTTELESYKNQASWSATGDQLCGTSYKVIYSDQYTSTTWWEWYGNTYYGAWSIKKEKLLNELMGWTHKDWQNWKVPYGQMPYAAKKLRNYLQAAADAGEPVREEDGSFMQLPAPYSVDYSKYTTED